MRYLHCCCVRLQMIVDPAAEDRRFHGSRPVEEVSSTRCPTPSASRQSCLVGEPYRWHPLTQWPIVFLCRSSPILVQIQSDVIHMCCTCTNIYLSKKSPHTDGLFLQKC